MSVKGTNIELVQRLVRDRDVLRPSFGRTWPRLMRGDAEIVDEWASATLGLSRVNAGPGAIKAFWQVADGVDQKQMRMVSAGGRAAADICRFAGARAALACLEVLPTAIRLTAANPAGLAAWWRGLDRLSREAPALVRDTVRRVETFLAGGDGMAFVDFVAAGLKATVRDKARRTAFFALEDPLAKMLLLRRTGASGFAESERMLAAFIAGLWGGELRLKASPLGGTPRRTMIASGTVLLPPVFAGVPGTSVRTMYRAAAAHAQAHLAIPAVSWPVLTLKPLQVALIGLVEDARVEALAIRRFPGLRRLWAAFHVASPRGAKTVVNLMARLARGLLDPDYADPDGFVEKGRALFAASTSQLDDPALSRSIGSLLGNDLGQMRMQFNAKTYVTEPAYRDDNMHLWALPETPDDALSMTVDAARGRDGEDGGETQPGEGAPAPRARAAAPDDQGAVLATYPEWDSAAGVERPDWTSLRDTVPVLGRPGASWAGDASLRDQVARLLRSSVVGQRVRQSRKEDGEELDIDATIEATIARRCGAEPDARMYRDRRPRKRDLATLIILDVSQSTAAIAAGGQSVLAAEQCAVAALAAALQGQGHRFALRAFASAGREDVRLTRLKDFHEPLNDVVSARLAGLSSGLSTRLGAALRHAGAELSPLPTTRKLVLVLTDGEPSDIDVTHADELVEDARRAVRGLRLRGIDVFGIVMDPEDAGSGSAIFGRHNAVAVRRLEELPAKLAGVYFRLTQR